ncbi:nucleoside triphosphate pyrophosphohydrolase family protein [Streptomyces katsurahamanus]|uniref:hypothetical protein n=1 Tax=Streptomyces katsurahamanus TaxID=2577098 RepID=UPI002B218F96|nr:hypothetical protein [Streptomyces katsurahamanus]
MLEFGLLTAEVGEAFTAWRKHLTDLGEELADVFLYLVSVAEMNGVDLGEEVARKIDRTLVGSTRRTLTVPWSARAMGDHHTAAWLGRLAQAASLSDHGSFEAGATIWTAGKMRATSTPERVLTHRFVRASSRV